MAKPKENFESSLKKLETIVTALEEPDLPLDESLKLFEEGIKEARLCESKLEETEGKVEQLLRDNGTLNKGPFAP